MKNRLLSILLLFSFLAIIIKPFAPFISFYLDNQKDIVETVDQCACMCDNDNSEPAKMASNGDAYLKALLKRVCDDEKKESPKFPVIQIPVFVKTLMRDHSVAYRLPRRNYHRISNFIIQSEPNSYIEELFRPPTLS